MTVEELFQWLIENQLRQSTDPEGFRADLLALADDVDIDNTSEDELGDILALVEGFTVSSGGDLADELSQRFSSRVNSEFSERRLDTDEDGEVSYEERRAAEQRVLAGDDDADRIASDLETLSELNAPRWLLDLFGAEPTDEQIAALLDQVEAVHGVRPATLQEAISAGWIEDPQVRRAIELAVGETPAPAFEPTVSIEFSTGNQFTMTAAELERVNGLTGMSEDQFAAVLQLADASDLRRADGSGIAWQPAALLAAAAGHEISGASTAARSQMLQRVRALRQQMMSLEAVGGQAYAAVRRQYETALAEWQASAPRSTRLDQNRDPDDPLRNLNLSGVYSRYQEGASMYGSEAIGMIHALDQGLAARLWGSNGDIRQVTADDIDMAGMYLSRMVPGSGSGSNSMSAALVELGFGEAGGEAFVADLLQEVEYLRSGGGGGGGGGGGTIRLTPDRVQVEQATRDMLRALYPTEVSDGTVASIADRVMAEYAGAGATESVDINSRIRRAVEDQPEYETFYGNMPAGVDEAQYQAIMQSGAQSMLGAEAGLTQAAGLGMRTGKMQTAVGAAAGTAAAWDNSTFLGRLARASQVTSANT